MIFPNNKILRKQSEAGVSLMLAILVLAAITAVAFSLATIVFIEIRSAGDASRTEPALYATVGVTEEALFQYKRLYDIPDDQLPMNVPQCSPDDAVIVSAASVPGGYNICNINSVSLTMPGNQPILFDESPRIEYLESGVTKTIPMYMQNSFAQQYDSIFINLLPNDKQKSVDVRFVANYKNNPVPTYLPGPTSNQTYSIDSGGNINPTIALSGEYQLEMILENNNNNQDLEVVIATHRTNAPTGEPQGLPYVGEQVLRILANYAGLNRTYQVRIPIP